MKTLYIDIETSPNVADLWSLAHGYVSVNQLRESSRMLCFAAKWRGQKRTQFFSEWDNGHENMVRAAAQLLDQADVLVHYNGHTFDVPIIAQELADLEIPPYSPFQEIDLLRVVRKRFRYPSNRLLYVAERLLGETKVSHEGHSLWTKVITGDVKARRKFKVYNVQDTVLLEKLHDRLLPWISNHPNVGLYGQVDNACPKCSSTALMRQGFSYTLNGAYQRYQCSSCGGWCTSTKRAFGVTMKNAG